MDSISELPDALLLKILSLLPTRNVATTMVLSKRWQLLWMMVPSLIYDHQDNKSGKFSHFVYNSLLFNEAPVLETLHINVGPMSIAVDIGESTTTSLLKLKHYFDNLHSIAVDIGVWTRTALKRCVLRELVIQLPFSSTNPAILPRSLYTRCGMLVKLKLKKVALVDVTCPMSFPSLKNLSLTYVMYPSDEFVQRLLSSCHVLESLYVKQGSDDNVNIFTVKVPSLKSLVLRKRDSKDTDNADGFVIDTPSLVRFSLVDEGDSSFCVIENEMPNIIYADVDVKYDYPWSLLSYLTSVKRLILNIASSSMDVYPVGTLVFSSLVYFQVWVMDTNDLNLLMRVLKDSPNLRALTLHQVNDVSTEPRPCWSEPSSVPKCLITSLETLKWTDYEGDKEESKVVAFILRNANCLKKAKFSTETTDPNKKLKMLKEMSLFTRGSRTCQLAFN